MDGKHMHLVLIYLSDRKIGLRKRNTIKQKISRDNHSSHFDVLYGHKGIWNDDGIVLLLKTSNFHMRI